jgi:hypothetical protein
MKALQVMILTKDLGQVLFDRPHGACTLSLIDDNGVSVNVGVVCL